MNQPRSQFFSNMAAFILSPHVLIIYAWSLLLTYLHIPSGFHNQRPFDSYRELYSGRNIDFALKNHCPISQIFFYFFGVAVRFD